MNNVIMKKLLIPICVILCVTACETGENPLLDMKDSTQSISRSTDRSRPSSGQSNDQEEIELPNMDNPISISLPSPTEALTKVVLTEEQQSYVDKGNGFSLNCLAELYKETGSSMVFSPLSLQYALAMVANGASGETAAEIIKTLGFGEDINSLNEFCGSFLNQLPALDPDVTVKLADAIVLAQGLRPLSDYERLMEESYYAPVETMDFSDGRKVSERINEWASRNTNGLICPLLEEEDLAGALAVVLNALYFKAPWSMTSNGSMFLPELTMKEQAFVKDGGDTVKVDMMPTSDYFGYAQRQGYRVVEIPYAGRKFALYVLLPDDVGKDGLSRLVSGLPEESWKEITGSLTYETEIHLRLPKFSLSDRFSLCKALDALGISKAFGEGATFDRMFEGEENLFISNVLQKARIELTEWGTEAAAVTAVMMSGSTDVVPPHADFFADHPFAFVLAERSSGAILFEGVYTGEDS